MNELPFGSVTPLWPTVPPSAWPQIASLAMNRLGGPGFGSPSIQPPIVPGGPFRSAQGFVGPTPEAYGFVGAPLPVVQPGLLGAAGAGFAQVPNPFAFPVTYSGIFPPGIPGLLTAVAMRRGQPAGPTTDQEIEDFVYDVLEVLAGTNDVEVRCEGARATLTGTVQHKRLKHDVGEIVWSIPAINDVQNNVTISTKRRGRTGAREGEQQTPARKQA
jgi:BON domain